MSEQNELAHLRVQAPTLTRVELAERLYRLNRAGYSFRRLARGMGWFQLDGKPARGKVSTYIRQHRARLAGADGTAAPREGEDRARDEDQGNPWDNPPALPRRTFNRVMPEMMRLPVYNGGQVVTGNAIVAADFHLPATNWPLVQHMIAVADHLLPRPRQLLLIGDLFNMDATSAWPRLVPDIPLSVEIDQAEQIIDWMAEVFDLIVFVLGNHEHRLFKALQGELDHVQFGNLMSRLNRSGRLRLSPYSWMVLVSGGVEWRLTHPKNYGRNKLIVASKLANKYRQNMIVAHQHHAAVGRDEWNNYTVIDNGGLFDYSMLGYTQLVDNTSPVMSEGFSVVIEGAGELLTPYPTMTNWARWLPASTLRSLPPMIPWQDRVRPPALGPATRKR